MTVLLFTCLLYAIAVSLLALAWRRGKRARLIVGMRTLQDTRRLLPRVAIGVLGAGFLAKALPQDIIQSWIGPQSGTLGIVIGAVLGGLTPGGPMVGYALGAAALKAGAGLPQIIAYATGWSLYTINRLFIWEVPTMPAWFVRLRLLVSLPFPVLAGWVSLWLT